MKKWEIRMQTLFYGCCCIVQIKLSVSDVVQCNKKKSKHIIEFPIYNLSFCKLYFSGDKVNFL